jgi:hypothetical protein
MGWGLGPVFGRHVKVLQRTSHYVFNRRVVPGVIHDWRVDHE